MTQTDLPTTETKVATPRFPQRFAGKVVLLTGGSDKGIGGAIARRLVNEGAAITILSRQEPVKLLARMRKVTPNGVQFVAGDVCDSASITRAVDATMGEFGQIDVLVNNAGIEEFGDYEQTDVAKWMSIVEINLLGAMKVAHAALPYLTEPGGTIVNISSALALGGCTGFAAYSASKAGLNGFTTSLAAELAAKKQRVVGVAPALVMTPMATRHGEILTEARWQAIEAVHPLGVGLPDDVANAVAFLASEEARWITGVTLPLGWMPSFALPVG